MIHFIFCLKISDFINKVVQPADTIVSAGWGNAKSC